MSISWRMINSFKIHIVAWCSIYKQHALSGLESTRKVSEIGTLLTRYINNLHWHTWEKDIVEEIYYKVTDRFIPCPAGMKFNGFLNPLLTSFYFLKICFFSSRNKWNISNESRWSLTVQLKMLNEPKRHLNLH